MATKWPQGEITPNQPATVIGGNNISGVYTLDQLNRLNADFGPQMQKSLRFRSSASAYLSRTPASAGNRTTWTWSVWVKRGALGVDQDIFHAINGVERTQIQIASDNTLTFAFAHATGYLIKTTQVFRDPSAWYHIVAVADTTQATAANRLKLYVNGVQITAFSTASYPTQNYSGAVNLNVAHQISSYEGTGWFFDGYMAEINFIDGQALDPSYFGKYNATTGVWQPSFYTGAYGTNGFHLTFANNASTTTLGYDTSGNGNNWTTNNISLTAGSTYDSMQDVPTNWTSGDPVQARGNYVVLNPLDSGVAPSSANLNWVSSGNQGTRSTIWITSGKWYWEYTSLASGQIAECGVAGTGMPITGSTAYAGSTADSWGFSNSSGNKVNNNTQTNIASAGTINDVLMVAVDRDSGKIWWGRNGTWFGSGDPASGANAAFSNITVNVTPAIGVGGASSGTFAFNFGQRPFAYTPPTGYKTLCTQNLPAATIYNGAQYMAATIYTGNGATQSIVNANNGVSFQPDFVWVKSRSQAVSHRLVDSVRGAGLVLYSNLTNAEGTDSAGVTAFNAGGFSVGVDTSYNNNGSTYVGWQWKAGGTAVTNTAGSITSQVSANTTSGFSVVTYTCQTSGSGTIGHGLGVAPALIINKPRTGTVAWTVYHQSLGNNAYLILNTTAAQVTGATTVWNSTSPDANVFTQGSAFAGLGTMVAYCFAAIPGYSAFGSYTGNGSADGPFVYCGFRPRYVLIKRTDSANDWVLMDSSRSSFNYADKILWPDLSDAEANGGTTTSIDFVSNGFKQRGAGGSINASGGTYIYAAFAENPFNYSLAR